MTLNAEAARDAKTQGMQLALDWQGDWKDRALLELRGWLAIRKAQGHATMTFEQFRHEARNQPTTHKAWGGFAGAACKAGLVELERHPDGSPKRVNAKSVKTHGHPVLLWRIR